jgi:AraC family transcriptional regulator of adaptative response/methylated-DNA-[protein]-cysteine methyltransferase
MTHALTEETCWRAVRERDAAFDGFFYYGVITTGVYCRPQCVAKRALRRNVRFFASRDGANAAGFRPCKRCRPEDASLSERRTDVVAMACRAIEEAEEPLTLDVLAGMAGMSPYHFHRLFKRIAGVTPRAYAAALRAERMRRELRTQPSITSDIYAAGYGASSRFYETAGPVLGMNASRYRNGADGVRIGYFIAPCELGLLLVALTGKGICAIEFGDEDAALAAGLARRFPKAVPERIEIRADLIETLAGASAPRATPLESLPLDIRATAFQARVWDALKRIPPGETASYRDIARSIGAPKAVRAVAGACAANPVALAIPCHRAVRSDGSLSGYRWGPQRKQALLERERAGKRRF